MDSFAQNSGRRRILFMDDEEMLRSVVTRMLEIMGYETVPAADGEEAVRLYREAAEAGRPFDAVILDLSVPRGMGGREAMKRLLEIDPDVVALISSGYLGDHALTEFRRYGFKGVVAKPYTSDELRDTLKGVLAGRVTS
ncbi:MAG: response regulator [Candidatus Krumholzibacteria bacterium]|nr:response regulator [Candidatus Krumholzibacteria bacterium]